MLFFLRNSYLRLFWGHLGQIEKILDFRVLILDFLEAREQKQNIQERNKKQEERNKKKETRRRKQEEGNKKKETRRKKK